MIKRLYIPIFILLSFIIVTLVVKINSIPAITFFPIDYSENFLRTNTNLELSQDSNTIVWDSFSESKTLYLRQDVSLLYANGQFKGVLSKWMEDSNVIQLESSILAEKERFLQAISYHHGEIHHQDDQINSIHYMSFDHLYVVNPPDSILKAFKKPNQSYELTWKQLLDDVTEQHLQVQWNEWINHYKINKNKYIVVPLIELRQFNDKNLPLLNKSQTDKIIGQLWEGLYKYYVIPMTKINKNSFSNHFMPVILFDKQNTHLLVLFNINGKNKLLLQKYSLE